MKKWYLSKTLWLNILAGAIALVQVFQGQAWFNAEVQVAILAILNALVRLITNTAIEGIPRAKPK